MGQHKLAILRFIVEPFIQQILFSNSILTMNRDYNMVTNVKAIQTYFWHHWYKYCSLSKSWSFIQFLFALLQIKVRIANVLVCFAVFSFIFILLFVIFSNLSWFWLTIKTFFVSFCDQSANSHVNQSIGLHSFKPNMTSKKHARIKTISFQT